MRFTPRSLFPALVVWGAAVFWSGCVTSKKYKMAKEGTPPEQLMNLRHAVPEAELKLSTVIIIKGPGSWKREARWDEYVVTLTNRGAGPLRIDRAALFDVLGAPQLPGSDPWKLEKLSHTNWDKYGKTGLQVADGAGAVVIYGTAVVATATGSLLSGTAAAAGTVAALNIIPVVALVDITAVAIMNHKNKQKIVAEFERRRLALPLKVDPGATVHGSFFFPMTPGPQRLSLSGQAGTPIELTIDLEPLAGLHLVARAKK